MIYFYFKEGGKEGERRRRRKRERERERKRKRYSSSFFSHSLRLMIELRLNGRMVVVIKELSKP
jgi:hypothetical protein